MRTCASFCCNVASSSSRFSSSSSSSCACAACAACVRCMRALRACAECVRACAACVRCVRALRACTVLRVCARACVCYAALRCVAFLELFALLLEQVSIVRRLLLLPAHTSASVRACAHTRVSERVLPAVEAGLEAAAEQQLCLMLVAVQRIRVARRVLRYLHARASACARLCTGALLCMCARLFAAPPNRRRI